MKQWPEVKKEYTAEDLENLRDFLSIDVKMIDLSKGIAEVKIMLPQGMYIHRSHYHPDNTMDMLIPNEVLEK